MYFNLAISTSILLLASTSLSRNNLSLGSSSTAAEGVIVGDMVSRRGLLEGKKAEAEVVDVTGGGPGGGGGLIEVEGLVSGIKWLPDEEG